MGIEEKSSILVTGADGFIGRTVAKLLGEAGARAVLLDSASPQSENSPRIRCDITDRGALESVFAGEAIGGIIHLAAILPTAATKNTSADTSR